MNYKPEIKQRKKYIAIDETKIKVNNRYFIYAAIDTETREIIAMRAYTTRNYLTTLDFIRKVVGLCSNRDFEVITDKMPCYKQVCNRLGIRRRHETFGRRKSKYLEDLSLLL